MARPRTFPAEIYVSVEEEGTEEQYFQVHTEADTAAEIGVKRRIGRYMLHETQTVEGKVVLVSTK